MAKSDLGTAMRNVFRKEIKYYVSFSEFYRITDRLDALMTRDVHGDNGTYHIRSLYFDSLGDRDFHDNLDGVMEKRKIRIRIYDFDDEKALLEYKCKSGSDSRKKSMVITREEAMELENRKFTCLIHHDEDIGTFLYNKMTQNVYQPRTVVEYDRTAFTYPVSDVRITFDHNLRGSLAPTGLFDRHLATYPIIEKGCGVLEVKYNDFLVTPLAKIISDIDKLPIATSKYSGARFLAYN